MIPAPDTRESLILRLPNATDFEAWQLFVEIYGPLLFRLARAKGLQHVDADDFVQEALTSVSKAIGTWTADDGRGKFRAWLFRIAQNLAVNFLTRPKYQRLGTGSKQVAELLNEVAEAASDSVELYRHEYRRELFRWAASEVRKRVSTKQWKAFWLTSVDGKPAQAVALQLEMSVGAVYIARSRITKQISKRIEKTTEEPR
jgi:RNA polymerase sigma-70 factor (ECF subfamily)